MPVKHYCHWSMMSCVDWQRQDCEMKSLGRLCKPTALVHEAFLRLADVETLQEWESRGHFFSAAAEAMRRILIENARKKGRQKHGGGWRRVDLENLDEIAAMSDGQVLALDEALEQLYEQDSVARPARQASLFRGAFLRRCTSGSQDIPGDSLSALGICSSIPAMSSHGVMVDHVTNPSG